MTKIVAHRGARGLAHHGNTTEAFELAIRLGAPWIELDVRRLADGAWVAHHDATIDGRPLHGLGLAELRQAASQRGYKPPTFDEVLELTRGRVRLDVELKEPGCESEVLDRLRAWDEHERWVVKSFHDAAVAATKTHDPDATVGLLVGLEAPSPRLRTRWSEFHPERRLRACGADFVGPYDGLVRGRFLRRMRVLGMPVWVWTVNAPERLEQLLRAGVAAVVTDRPDLALDIARRVAGHVVRAPLRPQRLD